jgi:hypothetical protein
LTCAVNRTGNVRGAANFFGAGACETGNVGITGDGTFHRNTSSKYLFLARRGGLRTSIGAIAAGSGGGNITGGGAGAFHRNTSLK